MYCVKGADEARKERIGEAGGTVVRLDPDSNGRLDILDILRSLKSEFGVERLMVEGGATVIRDFLARANEAVDSIIVTLSPKFISDSGISIRFSSPATLELSSVEYIQLGCDMILYGRPQQQSDTS